MTLTVLAPLRHRPFRLLFAGQLVSDLGDWLDFLALITLIVYRWGLGAASLAALSLAVALPWAVVAPVAGVWVDRWPRKKVMIVADLARALVVLGLVWAPNQYAVLALVFVKAIFSTFFSPARQATIRSTVPDEDLLAANSLSQLSVQITKVVGPALGGLLVAALGPRVAFVVDSMTFLISAAFLTQLPALAVAAAQAPGEGEEKPSFWDEFRAGLVYIIRRRALALAVASMSGALFIIFTFDSLGVLALKTLGVDEALFGLAVGSIGLGTALGAIAVGHWGREFHPFGIMGFGQVTGGLLVALLGIAVIMSMQGTGIGGLLVYMVVGFSSAAVFAPYSYVVQLETPPELMGRVFASATGIQTVFQLAAPPLGAILAEQWGVGAVFAASGVALALVGAGMLLVRPTVGIDESEANPGRADISPPAPVS